MRLTINEINRKMRHDEFGEVKQLCLTALELYKELEIADETIARQFKEIQSLLSAQSNNDTNLKTKGEQ